jgi:hypothetical protein
MDLRSEKPRKGFNALSEGFSPLLIERAARWRFLAA